MSTNKSSADVTTQLRDKIKSKMDVAKFFSGFIPIFLGLAFKEVVASLHPVPPNASVDDGVYWAAWIGILFVLLALAFSIATMFSLDRLLMPPEFWESQPVTCLNEKLKEEMVRAWRRLFYPTVLFFLIGVTAFLCALTNKFKEPLGILVVTLIVAFLAYKSLGIGREIHG